jgi:hypothetical protein
MAKHLPVILSHRNGKQYLRSKPEKVRQTPQSQRTAHGFGTASALASALVETFAPLIAITTGTRVYHRLLSALVNWKHEQFCNPQPRQADSIFFKGFRFVPKAGINNRFKLPVNCNYDEPGQVVINIPAFIPRQHIIAPPGCSAVLLKIAVASTTPATGSVIRSSVYDASIPYDSVLQPAWGVTDALPTGAGILTLVAMALQYDRIPVHAYAKAGDMKWMPAGIISSYYSAVN